MKRIECAASAFLIRCSSGSWEIDRTHSTVRCMFYKSVFVPPLVGTHAYESGVRERHASCILCLWADFGLFLKVCTIKSVSLLGFISNEAGRVKLFLHLFLPIGSFVFFSGHTHPFARKRCSPGRMIFGRRQFLICVHPTRSARDHFIISVLPTNHLFDHCGP